MRDPRGILFGVIWLCLFHSAATALEQGGKVEDLRLYRGENGLLCDLALSDLFTSPIENTLRSGLPVVVDIAMVIVPERGTELGRLLRSELSYDVWEDVYTLRRAEGETTFTDFVALRQASRRYGRLALTELDEAKGSERLHFRLRVSVNPLGGSERRRMARWLAETVSDPDVPANRELLLDLGGLIGSFFGDGDEAGWGEERSFGPYELSELRPSEDRP